MHKHFTLIAIYTLIGVPWYWELLPESWAMQRAWGLPLWVAVSVAGSFGVSLHTCLIFCRPWDIESADAKSPDKDAGISGKGSTPP